MVDSRAWIALSTVYRLCRLTLEQLRFFGNGLAYLAKRCCELLDTFIL